MCGFREISFAQELKIVCALSGSIVEYLCVHNNSMRAKVYQFKDTFVASISVKTVNSERTTEPRNCSMLLKLGVSQSTTDTHSLFGHANPEPEAEQQNRSANRRLENVMM